MINTEEYMTLLDLFMQKKITEQEWRDYCSQLLTEILKENKDVLIRLKERE
jgi:GH24 family phage-related lysozyme (muramidase)